MIRLICPSHVAHALTAALLTLSGSFYLPAQAADETSTPSMPLSGMSTAASLPATTAPVPAPSSAGKMVDYINNLQTIHAYWITPKGNGPWPAVIIAHDIFGLTPYIKREADDLAAQGYAVVVPDLYSRENIPNGVGTPPAAKRAYDNTPDQQVISDLQSALDFLAADPATVNQPVGVVGFDLGGSYAMLLAATDLRIKAAVNFYGRIKYANTSPQRPVSPFEDMYNLKAPMLSFYGTDDLENPGADIDMLDARLRNNPNKTYYNLVRLPGVHHGFEKPQRLGYDPVAATDAKKQMKDFLAKTLLAAPATTSAPAD